MNRKKIDNRIRLLIENNVIQGYRSIFAVVGEKARDQVVILHHMLLKSQIKPKPNVLWCYKRELGFSTNRKKRIRMVKQKEKAGNASFNEDDPFEMFISGTNIRWCYYHETDRILGSTYDMLVLQDFEAITPNLLARTVETVEGGGIIIILLNTLNSLKQLYKMAMDVHNRYRTEAHKDIVARFNERFILSLASCPNFLPIDERLNILPLSSHIATIEPVSKPDPSKPLSPKQQELADFKKSLASQQPLGSLVNCCKTLDQVQAVMTFVESLSDKSLRTTISMTAARGRGKSAALGLAIAGAIAYNYCNIFVTSPSPENLKTLFDFIIKGLDAIHLKQHLDYEIVQSTKPEFNKAIVRINVLREFQQTIQYITPSEVRKDSLLWKSAELVVIDEAAAIPLPIVRSLLGPYLVFMSSTINGYEGTGRSLSLKLLRQLRDESVPKGSKDDPESRVLREITLEEPIRYKSGDHVEAWLNQLLCLNVNNEELKGKKPPPKAEDCKLFYINRDTLFSFHPASEAFLQKLMALYVSSHYKNSPNDLQMMSDAPAHHLFCLLGPSDKDKKKLPEVLCFLQVCLEGEITKQHIMDSLNKGKRAAGDLIPWTLSQQFQDTKFPSLSGARVVRIAANPNYQGQGYGSQALHLLCDYYQGKFITDTTPVETDITMADEDDAVEKNENDSDLSPQKRFPPLLTSLDERRPERLDYMGVCYGITYDLYRFWKSNGFVPVYLRQTTNELTGENSCIMIKILSQSREERLITVSNDWLVDFWIDFRRRFVSLLAHAFKKLPTRLALEIITQDSLKVSKTEEKSLPFTNQEIDLIFNEIDLNRIGLFTQNQITKLSSSQGILDILPSLSQFYFTQRFDPSLQLDKDVSAILIGLGLQRKSLNEISLELNHPVDNILSLLKTGLNAMNEVLIKMKKQ